MLLDRGVISAVVDEMVRADARYGDYASTHEALGVLAEEWDELRAEVRANNLVAVAQEAVQLASCALRLAKVCQEAARSAIVTEFGARSTGMPKG